MTRFSSLYEETAGLRMEGGTRQNLTLFVELGAVVPQKGYGVNWVDWGTSSCPK